MSAIPRITQLFAMLCLVLAGTCTLAAKEPGTPVEDSQGNQLYMVVLDEGLVELQSEEDEIPPRSTRDTANRTDFRGWHRPKMRKLLRILESKFGISAVSMTSWAMPTFSAYLPDSTVRGLQGDPRVRRLIPIRHGTMEFSAWADRWDGSELVSWGKIAIGTDDSLTSSNTAYIVDGGARADHADLSVVDSTAGTPAASPPHATHVAGIIGARRNNSMVRGVNPGLTIINVNRGWFANEFATAMDWVLADAESHGIYGVVNVSSNYDMASPEGGVFRQYFKRMSNRLLVVQSAGNQRQSACTRAYDATNNWDGIMVVGGTDENNAQVGQNGTAYDNTGIGWSLEPGSNFGTCVDIWAPSLHIWSTWDTSTTATQILSGTSMAAPFISGLAARFGSSQTLPVERENQIYARQINTGLFDDAGVPIYTTSYTQPPAWGVASRLPVSAVSADSNSASAGIATDGWYLNGAWNAGHNPPAWIEFDLGAVHYVQSIRLSPDQWPEGNVVHKIYMGFNPAPTDLVATISGIGRNLEPFSAGLGNLYARYVRVVTESGPSWVAWREVEIYGW